MRERAAGFTLIELLVVVLILGILAAIAIPQYFKIAERGRLSEAVACFDTIKGAQERYLIRFNTYSGLSSSLDTECAPNASMKAFTTPVTLSGATNAAYTATLTRKNPTPAVYGAYVISFIGPAGTFACSQSNCTNDLLPQ